MIKNVCVVYDELKKPIEVLEIKHFTDIVVLESFIEECNKNKQEYEKRLELAKKCIESRINELEQQVFALKDENKSLKKEIAILKGEDYE